MGPEISTAEEQSSGPSLAGRREWVALAVLALPTLLLSLDMSVLYLALPHLSADLGASATQQLWIMDIYGFMIAGFLITMGTLGDRIGRRRLLMIGGAAFAAASVLAAFSTSAEMLIVTRALLGIAGATLMPSTLALISTMFRDAHQRGVAIAVWMTCFMGGMTIGPLVGGVLLEAFWWGAAFLLGVPVMALLLIAAPILLPEFKDPDAGKLDLLSVLLSLLTILPVIFGLKELAHSGWQVAPVTAIAVGVVFGVVFVRRQLRLKHPHIDVTLFHSTQFSTGLATNVTGGLVMAGTFLLVSQFLQLVEGLSPLRAGLWLAPMNVAMALASISAPYLARRFRPALVMASGFALGAVGLVVVAQSSTGGLLVLVAGFAVTCMGVALPSALVVNLIISAAPHEKAGAASGISETSGELGIALGVAVFGSLGAAVYRSQFMLPEGVSGAAADDASDSIVGAVTTAGSLPPQQAAGVLDSAREAFTSALNINSAFGAVAFAVMALAVGWVFRALRPVGEEEVPASVEWAADAKDS